LSVNKDIVSSETNCSNRGFRKSITVKNINKGTATYRIFLTRSNSDTADSKTSLYKIFFNGKWCWIWRINYYHDYKKNYLECRRET
jgi:hypothetical protein